MFDVLVEIEADLGQKLVRLGLKHFNIGVIIIDVELVELNWVILVLGVFLFRLEDGESHLEQVHVEGKVLDLLVDVLETVDLPDFGFLIQVQSGKLEVKRHCLTGLQIRQNSRDGCAKIGVINFH